MRSCEESDITAFQDMLFIMRSLKTGNEPITSKPDLDLMMSSVSTVSIPDSEPFCSML